MIGRLRDHSEKHKILFVHVIGAIFLFAMYWFGKLFKYYFSADNELYFWILFFVLFFPYLLFMKWFARIKTTD